MFLVIFDIAMAIVFFLMGLLFYKSNGKAIDLLTGYNQKSKEERSKINEREMCRIYGKRMMYWSIPFLIGAVTDFYIAGIGFIFSWGAWIVLFIRHMIDRSKREK